MWLQTAPGLWLNLSHATRIDDRSKDSAPAIDITFVGPEVVHIFGAPAFHILRYLGRDASNVMEAS